MIALNNFAKLEITRLAMHRIGGYKKNLEFAALAHLRRMAMFDNEPAFPFDAVLNTEFEHDSAQVPLDRLNVMIGEIEHSLKENFEIIQNGLTAIGSPGGVNLEALYNAGCSIQAGSNVSRLSALIEYLVCRSLDDDPEPEYAAYSCELEVVLTLLKATPAEFQSQFHDTIQLVSDLCQEKTRGCRGLHLPTMFGDLIEHFKAIGEWGLCNG